MIVSDQKGKGILMGNLGCKNEAQANTVIK
jgi:hypothetical protein